MKHDKSNLVHVDRVRPLLEREIEKANYYPQGIPQNSPTGGIGSISLATGVSSKCISDVMCGRRTNISFTTLDNILTGLDLVYLTAWPAEDGGFKDIFDSLQTSTRKYYPSQKKKVPCPRCDGEKSAKAEMCTVCRKKRRDAERDAKQLYCSDCGKHISKKSNYANMTGYCVDCLNSRGGAYALTKRKGNAEFRENIKHTIRRKGYGA